LVGLMFNLLLLFGIMAMFGFTFTLPGIAGIILTVGMAVDANVLIYERLREEIEAGKSLRSALHAAYDKAFSAILDSNLTSLITAAILFWRASGTVKGFAVTLTIGLVASMLAALMLTRVLFWWGNDLKILKKLSFLSLIPNNLNFDFLGKRRISLVVSVLITLVAVGTLAVKREGALGIDFTGGTLIRFQLGSAQVPTDEVEKALTGVALSAPAPIQQEDAPGTGGLLSVRTATEDAAEVLEALREKVPVLAEKQPGTLISFQLGSTQVPTAEVEKALVGVTLSSPTLVEQKSSAEMGGLLQVRTAPQDAEAVVKVLREKIPALADKSNETTAESAYKIVNDQDEVSATLGGEFLMISLVALGLGLIGILVYIGLRYEFAFAVGGFVALAHDIFLTIGLVVLFGDKLSLIHVGAILTIAGYSINDTIIVFDRVRESLQMRGSKNIEATMNEAINSTLSRTVLTSGATLLMVIMLYIFGSSSLREFSFMIFIGIVLGTFSSIFVACPIVLWWAKLRGTKLGHNPAEPAAPASSYKAVQ
jgi:SecD/SecF fusion protein